MKKINAKIYADEDFPGKFFIRHDNGRVEVANVVTPKRTTVPYCKVEFKISDNN